MRLPKAYSILSAVASLAIASQSAGVTIVAYTPGNQASDPGSPDPGVAASVVATNVTAATLARGAGLSWNTGGDFNSRSWDGGTDSASAQTAGDYIEWGFTTTVPIDLATLDIRYDRSPTGPTNVDILVAINGGSFSSVFTDGTVSTSSENNAGIDLSAHTSVTSATFRLAGWGASSGAGTFDVEDTTAFDGSNGLVVSGTFVPEPTTALLGALGLLGILRRRR